MKHIAFSIILLILPDTLYGQVARRDHALFFVCAEYDNGLWVDLPQAKSEMDVLSSELRNQFGFTVETISNPRKVDIARKLQEYIAKTYNPDDQLLIFFSMHGHYNRDLDEGYLIPRDGEANLAYSDSWLNHNDLNRYMNLIKCQHVLVALDACYSGSFGLLRSAPEKSPWEEELDCQTKVRQALRYKTRLYTASGSKDDRTPAISQFAQGWLNALRGKDDDNIISFAELMSKVTKAQPRPVFGEFRGNEPGGDFVFVKKGKCSNEDANNTNRGNSSQDTDNDGISDQIDKCPDIYGALSNMGCPEDTDKDGVYDISDKCPDLPGKPENNGCPTDRDNDGVYDKEDRCPDLPGILSNKGCPADRDQDGVYDTNDQCPDKPGPISNKGCPERKPEVDGPGIKLTSLVYDYGNIKKGSNGNSEFTFENNGNEPLIIKHAKGSCGCVIPTYPKSPIMPGAKEVIKVWYDTMRVGLFTKTVTISTNCREDTITLMIKGVVHE